MGQPANEFQNILAPLRKGAWIFSDILPAFRGALRARLNGRSKLHGDWSTTKLTAEVYQPHLKLQEVGCKSQVTLVSKNATTADNLLFWTSASRLIKKEHDGIADSAPNEAFALAMESIKLVWPEAELAFNTHFSYYTFLKTNKFQSASHPHLWGTLFLKPTENAINLAISIVHEAAHQEMFLLNTIDRLIQIQGDSDNKFAPYQNKLRPAIGRLHSAHALFRMIEFCERAGIENQPKYCDLLDATVQSFSGNVLTGLGQSLLNEVYV